ncbi:gypsy retrotransposon integrase 1 [Plakobranchus ocellatus]|uniref:Gypsy retrotransposon integrase 1 n=1 Tax=Plakobranchus ocellatus TaxID=259542 RepID=A0AAV4BG40_9GAST|nr:gypsy retrotransposon integrase 1 [Plakobranchus ocellatus]
MGDFNAKAGDERVEDVVGPSGVGTVNERGSRLIEWCQVNDFTITNTWYQNHPRRQWNWKNPGDRSHTGWRKTLANIKEYFSWPGLSKDVLDYVRFCRVCQIKSPSGRDRPAPYQPMPLIVQPFSRVVIDLVGPLPLSNNRSEYILTLIDVAFKGHLRRKKIGFANFKMTLI